MANATIDTLKYANALKSAGVPAQQAEAFTSALDDVFKTNFKAVVSQDEQRISNTELRNELKSMFEMLRLEMKTGFEQLRTEMKANVEQLRTEMKANVEQLRAEIKNNVDQLRHEIRECEQRTNAKIDLLKSELNHLKWVVYSVLVGTIIMILRVYVFKSAAF